MKLLRLDNNTEFFKDEINAKFLGNIADINVIIGANNTRKSRFLRSIINQVSNVVIDGDATLNKSHYDSLNIFDKLSTQGKDALNERYLHFQFHEAEAPSDKYNNIKGYFNTKSQIDYIDLKASITDINERLTALATDRNSEQLKAIVRRTYDVTEMLIWVYEVYKRDGFPTEPERSFNHSTNTRNIRYRCELPSNNEFPFFELKFEVLIRVKKYLEILLNISAQPFDGSLIYIPVLRSSRMIGGFTGDVYADTILKQHFGSPSAKLSIETGLMLYDKIGLARNGTRKQARDFTQFEKFIGTLFFSSDDLHIVALQSEKKEERYVQISLPGELEDISIQDLGDGIQAIINLLFPIFTANEGSWIFIDEPENHLHPGYQNMLMKILSSNEFIRGKNLRFFINTHSNHILSGALLSAESSEIFVFSRRNEHSSAIQSFNGNEYNTLEMLGIFNTSVLTSNCSVWVEGVTDRFYLQAFLYAYCDHLSVEKFNPVEGINYSFVEYGGKNLIHYEFDHEFYPQNAGEIKGKIDAYFINANVFLLADSDFNEEKHKHFEEIKRANFKYCKTNLPEIENILPEEILKGYFADELKCDKKEVDSAFPIDHKMKLGEHFKGKFTYGKGYRAIEAESGGTLSPHYKKGLANFVHKKILDKTYGWDQLKGSEILKNTIVQLYLFIKANNDVK